MLHNFIGFDYRTRLNPAFDCVVNEFGLTELVTLDYNLFERTEKTCDELEPSGYCYPLWDTYFQLDLDLAPANLHERRFCIGLVDSPHISLAYSFEHYFPLIPNTEVCPNMNMIGYDVGDEAFFSGIWNMGLDHGIIKSQVSLNQLGLISEINSAMAFASYVGDFAPDHIPFFVFEIFEIVRGHGDGRQ